MLVADLCRDRASRMGCMDDSPRVGNRSPLTTGMLQWRLGSGQIYDLAGAVDLFADDPQVARLFKEQGFDADGRRKAALTYDLWWRMTSTEQRLWLARYLEEEQVPCRSQALPRRVWDEADSSCGPAVRRLAGTFADCSGSNCFGEEGVVGRVAVRLDCRLASLEPRGGIIPCGCQRLLAVHCIRR